MVDIATRVYNHTWKIDPIVRSVIDTDFYKLLMAQTIFRRHRDVEVTFGIKNRTTRVRLAEIVDEGELREQLDHIRTLRLTRGESTFLRGNTFYGKRQMFSPEFMDWLEKFRFPEYQLEKRDGQYELTFHGPWVETTMWEIPALAILNELRSRGVLKGMAQVRAAGALRPRHDAGLGEDRAAEEPAGPVHLGFRHAPPPRLPVAGLVRAGDDRGPRAVLPRHLELPHRAAARGRGGRHQRARAADGLRGPRRLRRGARARPPTRAGRLAGGLRGQSAA